LGRYQGQAGPEVAVAEEAAAEATPKKRERPLPREEE
jgi:hypothetical protein